VPDPDLTSHRVLIIEDEHLVARSMCRILRVWGAEIVGPASSVEQALELLRSTPGITAAMLDIDLRGVPAYAVADELIARGIGFVFATGFSDRIIPDSYRQAPVLQKPYGPDDLARALFPQALSAARAKPR
jgi:CheY-like chemotaxis protein